MTRPRLATPLVRRGSSLEPAGWDEAISRAAEGLGAIAREHGGSALGFFSCSKATNETNFIAQKFARLVLGTNNVDSCNRT